MYVDRQKLDPLHLEINSWQHALNLLYLEVVRRGKYCEFDSVLRLSKSQHGCGLKYIADLIQEHHKSESTRMKTLTIRLIGSQAINLAQFGYRLIDAIKHQDDSGASNLIMLALGKIFQTLRDICSFINRVNDITSPYPDKVETLCKTYFNLYALFFPKHCNITVWTM